MEQRLIKYVNALLSYYDNIGICEEVNITLGQADFERVFGKGVTKINLENIYSYKYNKTVTGYNIWVGEVTLTFSISSIHLSDVIVGLRN